MAAYPYNKSLDDRLRLQELRSIIERMMEQQVLKDALVLPALSQLQLLLGALATSRAGLTDEVRSRLLAAMMMIYHGLCLHETIEEGVVPVLERRQLTILGGDYLSSLFYKVLAEVGHVSAINLFAKAIAAINEAKMSRHQARQSNLHTDGEYLRHGETIHGALLHTLCEIFLPEERVVLFIDLAVAAAVWDEEMAIASRLGQQTRFGVPERVQGGFHEALSRLREASSELFGAEAWTQIQLLFTYAETSVASTKAVEGG